MAGSKSSPGRGCCAFTAGKGLFSAAGAAQKEGRLTVAGQTLVEVSPAHNAKDESGECESCRCCRHQAEEAPLHECPFESRSKEHAGPTGQVEQAKREEDHDKDLLLASNRDPALNKSRIPIRRCHKDCVLTYDCQPGDHKLSDVHQLVILEEI